jgi:RNA-directed DNA polymerase
MWWPERNSKKAYSKVCGQSWDSFINFMMKDLNSDRMLLEQEEFFRELFQLENIQSVYENKIAETNVKGVDRLGVSSFDNQKDFHFNVIKRKCHSGIYRLSPYAEILRSEGRKCYPRVISIPTIRDRIVLFQLKEFLHKTFDDCVNRNLPNSIIEEISKFLQTNNNINNYSFIKLDIKSFYDNIDHEILLSKLRGKIVSKNILRIIKSAVEAPTVVVGQRKVPPSYKGNLIGVPQGLAISNILADIYLHELDEKFQSDVLFYKRYVDDIFCIVNREGAESCKQKLIYDLNQLKLNYNEDKSKIVPGDKEFEYLGYRLQFPLISVRQSTIDKFINSIVARFTSYRNGTTKFLKEHPEITPEVHKEVFLEDLNEKITGALNETKRYGWIFFFLQINDLQLLHKLDSIIKSFFTRLDDFNNSPPDALKSLSKSYYEARYSTKSGYIHDYNKYITIQEKITFLNRRGIIDKGAQYRSTDIDRIFETTKRQHLSKLEIDVGTIS